VKRDSPLRAAARTAFSKSSGSVDDRDRTGTIRTSIGVRALAFVVGFPGVLGLVAMWVALSRQGVNDGAFPLAVGSLALAGLLLVLGALSSLSVGPGRLTVRFFGLRATSVRFDELAEATFGMAWPSISFAITLRDRHGRTAVVHANRWRDEAIVMRRVCQALYERDVAMDRSTARIVAATIRVKRPKARILHHAIFRRDRTW
jgi:hypothetical protein